MGVPFLEVNPNDLTEIGVIDRTVGMRGGIVLRWHDTPFPCGGEEYPEWLFITREGIPVPFRILAVDAHAEGWVSLSLDGITTREQAQELRGERAFLRRDDLLQSRGGGEGDSAEHHALVGCDLRDQQDRLLGRIVAVRSFSMSVVLIVRRGDGTGEFMTPYHPDLVLASPQPGRSELRIHVPEGVMEL